MQEKEHPSKPKHSPIRQVLLGAVWCNAGMFLVAPVVATLYQFPAFPNGKVGGLEGLFTNGWAETLLAVWFTLIVFVIAGGFVALGVLGGVAGYMSYKVFGASVDYLYWRTVGCALVMDIVVAVVFALAADALAPHLMFYS
jgi:hypothetical protein